MMMQGGSKGYLCVKGVLEDFTERFGIILRLARLCSKQYSGFNPLGHSLAHEFRWKLHSPAEVKRKTMQMRCSKDKDQLNYRKKKKVSYWASEISNRLVHCSRQLRMGDSCDYLACHLLKAIIIIAEHAHKCMYTQTKHWQNSDYSLRGWLDEFHCWVLQRLCHVSNFCLQSKYLLSLKLTNTNHLWSFTFRVAI